MSSSSYAVEVKNLSFRFAQHSSLFFEDISFQLEKGKLHHLKGKNGSGKSTLFSLMRGEVSGIYTTGELLIQQQRYTSQELIASQKKLRKQLTLVNQRYDALIADQFSFQDNLRFASLPRFPTCFKTLKDPARLPAFLERLGIDLTLPAYRLSGGQRQILALTMALQKSPSLLLLDEPTATLDSINSHLVFQFLQELTFIDKITILTICHDHDLINEYCNGQQLEIDLNKNGIRKIKKQ